MRPLTFEFKAADHPRSRRRSTSELVGYCYCCCHRLQLLEPYVVPIPFTSTLILREVYAESWNRTWRIMCTSLRSSQWFAFSGQLDVERLASIVMMKI